MYNRYVPQADGSFRRSRIPDSVPEEAETVRPDVPPVKPEIPEAKHQEPKMQQPSRPRQQMLRRPQNANAHMQSGSRSKDPVPVGGFLRQLIPANFDTEDLIVVLLLLLMSGDSNDEQSNALLTLALYMFL